MRLKRMYGIYFYMRLKRMYSVYLYMRFKRMYSYIFFNIIFILHLPPENGQSFKLFFNNCLMLQQEIDAKVKNLVGLKYRIPYPGTIMLNILQQTKFSTSIMTVVR